MHYVIFTATSERWPYGTVTSNVYRPLAMNGRSLIDHRDQLHTLFIHHATLGHLHSLA